MAMNGISRVSDMWRMNTLLAGVRRGNLQLAKVQQQLATGDRMLAPSDDPAGANTAMSLQRVLASQQQLLDNIKNAGAVINVTDSTLGEAANLLLEAQGVASANVGTAATQDQRNAAAQIVAQLSEQMLSLANYKLGDVYIFAGTANTSTPFVSGAAGIRYVGENQATQALLGGPRPVQVGLTGNEVFGAMSSEVSGYRDLTPRLTAGTRLIDLGGAAGGGVTLGSIVIDDGTVKTTVDLAGCDRIGDVIDRINTATGGAVTASIGPASNLVLTAGDPLALVTVAEIGSGMAAHDLGIFRSTVQVGGFAGDNVRPRVTATTQLSDLAAGGGIDLSGLVISCGGKTETIDLSAAETVGDLLNGINTANLGVLARIKADGSGIDVVNTLSGAEMRIGENGGTTAAELGIRSLRGEIALGALNDGLGVETLEGLADLTIVARDGATFDVDLYGALTVQDVIDRINAAATAAGVAVSADLAIVGNGIELTDATGGAGELRVDRANGSTAAADLGLQKAVTANRLTGDDVNGIRPSGVFAHLAELENALRSGQSARITRAAERVKADYDQIVRLRARVGGLAQDLTRRQDRAEDQQTANLALLSDVKDVDFAEAVTRFQALQAAMEGNLLTGAQLLNLSLMDFLR